MKAVDNAINWRKQILTNFCRRLLTVFVIDHKYHKIQKNKYHTFIQCDTQLNGAHEYFTEKGIWFANKCFVEMC
jgi:hypothetical protein